MSYPPLMRISEDEFEALVERAMERLPEEFAELLDNIAVVMENEPEPELKHEMGMDAEEELLGLYLGVPFGERDSAYSSLPDQVVLYRGPLVRISRDRRELIREVRDTLVHEIGHYFGLSDEEMPY
ncbi:MAG: metallopeptidase family protein [bacterium]|nr:metallopeptidase family protein [bacterium]